jgi:hypothetical protein
MVKFNINWGHNQWETNRKLFFSRRKEKVQKLLAVAARFFLLRYPQPARRKAVAVQLFFIPPSLPAIVL